MTSAVADAAGIVKAAGVAVVEDAALEGATDGRGVVRSSAGLQRSLLPAASQAWHKGRLGNGCQCDGLGIEGFCLAYGLFCNH